MVMLSRRLGCPHLEQGHGSVIRHLECPHLEQGHVPVIRHLECPHLEQGHGSVVPGMVSLRAGTWSCCLDAWNVLT